MNEVWKNVSWCSDYQVSSLGRVRSFKNLGGHGREIEPHLLTPSPCGRHGYMIVTLHVDRRQIIKPLHRLVGEAFLGPQPAGLMTRHLDGNYHNNHADNLTYGTSTENNQDKVRHGTSRPGEKHHYALLTDFGARVARRAVALGMKQTHVASVFGVSKQVINGIVRERTYQAA